MRILEFIEHSVSPTTKLIICTAIGLALFVVYYWEPNRKQKKPAQKKNTGFSGYIEVDPNQYDEPDKMIGPIENKKASMDRHPTLEQLNEYVEQVKRYKFENIDRV
ncbi:MAG: hypothetical protein C4527_14865 [Candidatus Omnitrophota bacterium]|jgi:uncharacterized protein YaaR (DUF327 family)|nr:MAG: hypothetical protein C4527_14865 [Candidatus Omnitrophota bacterium]